MKISASILSIDCLSLREAVKVLENGGVNMLHMDVMDGSFVDNITFGNYVISSIKKNTNLPIDIHLMIQNPEKHIETFAQYADILTIHLESVRFADKTLKKIRSLGVKAGISINPCTHELNLEYLYDSLDSILIMTVNPGLGGQDFIKSQINKIRNISEKLSFLGLRNKINIAVDGGVNIQNIQQIIDAGADTLIIGSALSGKGLNEIEMKNNLDHFKKILHS